MTRIEELWAAIRAEAREHRIFRRVDGTHPLDLYAGINQDGDCVLLLVTDREVVSVPPPGAVEVAVNQREDGRWAVQVQLARADLGELFGRLCQDLVDNTRSSTRATGGQDLLRRLHRWRKLLEPAHHPTLSEQELRGLLGELWVLDTIVLPRLGPVSGVLAWNGPFGASQDFLIGEALLEVKTVTPGARTVPISSLEQLDAATPLWLAVVVLTSGNATGPGGLTPSSLVSRIRETIEGAGTAPNEFTLRLAEAGYEDGATYADREYQVANVRYFLAGEGFPRLRRAFVPTDIAAATYEILLGALVPYEGTL